ncbi:hypothetical protein A2230_03355 [candidate division WOR-1 bacterium RIFOXYA2_FULL_36_21]|uniref:Uncharacterized protein n=1 Tax=candidate division WOR-1 bacterium RIFOXYB2_FULL_36_35 TaxID=1802578 RepID=A0A1F4RZT8_UNCSA|nr:MAG: hypothetical protein A2230_03355 [candidate division WOR-1 bacterium RIFOXYA2_FULL_36_21]OGC12983.1 MAG: hypothetical protein A2290_04955 [candidate division WOR-1 bacterium RIFOXYB2_FULL_36_35]OGC15197.1 MAG: hypothetical protein A2282_07555 [candidate division WOR-1 bacterium RIFOXYA12_FULL_36_13]
MIELSTSISNCVTVKKANPAYNRTCSQKLRNITDRTAFSNMETALSENIISWKTRLPKGAKLVMVSDPWIGNENLGGSLLLRTFYGLLNEYKLPLEWWTVDVSDDPIGLAYHQICYDLYVGIKGESEIGVGRNFSLFQEQLRHYERILKESANRLISSAQLKDGDQILLLDINVIGLAKYLRQGTFRPSLLMDNLRIGRSAKNPIYQSSLEFLRRIGVYESLDIIQHLHDSFITDPYKEISIGGFCNFADPHNCQITPEEAWINIESILAYGKTTDQFSDFVSRPQIHEKPLMLSEKPEVALPLRNHRLFYAAARIDKTKNFSLILQAYAKAYNQDPVKMGQTSLVLMMPSPSELNNAVEMAAIHSVVEEIFNIYQLLDNETKKHIFIYFIPMQVDGMGMNRLFNESFQNIADVQLNISDAEGLPNAVFDAMSHRNVPLVHASCGMIDQVEDGISGFSTYENSASELAALYLDIAGRSDLKQIGEAAYQRLTSRFHPFRYINDFLKLAIHRANSYEEPSLPPMWPTYADRDTKQWLEENGIDECSLASILTNRYNILDLYNDLRLKYGEDFALLLMALTIQTPDLEKISATLNSFKKGILQPTSGSFYSSFHSLTLEEKARKIRGFMGITFEDSFTHDYVPLIGAFQNLFNQAGLIGDCNNLTYIFFMICKYLGQPVRYYMDIYHTFLSMHDLHNEVPVDQAYSDNVLATDYHPSNGQIIHKNSGRKVKNLTHKQILALFLCRQASEVETDTMRKKVLLEAALTIDSDIAEIHNDYGDIYFQLGQYQAAQHFYETAIQKESHNIFFQLNYLLSVFIQDRLMNHSQLLQGIDRILNIYPKFAEAYYFRYLLTRNPEDRFKAEEYGYTNVRLLFYCKDVKPKLTLIERLLNENEG